METSQVPSLEAMFSDIPVSRYPYHRTFEEARDEPFCVVHTSGSTGLPKPVFLTQGYVMAFDGQHHSQPFDARTIQTSLVTKNTRVYNQMPPFHVSL
jgi:acyl-coenzyme A synthetase/AMP-(fatty) acid ligase